MLHTKFRGNRSTASGDEGFFKDFYHIWAWRPSWSCDLDQLYKHSFPLSKESLHERGTCVKPVFSPLQKPKYESYHTTISSRCFIR